MKGEPSTRLAASLLDPDGKVIARWGPDAEAVGDIPRGLTFTTSDPGGFKDSTAALSRRIDRSWPDLRLLRDIRYYGAGNRTAWEGRLQETPAHHADDFAISPGAVGHVVELDDDPSFAEIYLDRELSKWGEPTTQRRLNLINSNVDPSAVTMSQSAAGEGAAEGAGITAQYQWLKAGKEERGELLYYNGGVNIGRVLWDLNGRAATEDATFFNGIFLSPNGVDSSGPSANSNAVTALGKSVTNSKAGYPYAILVSTYGGAAAIDPYLEAFRWLNLMVTGTHGLTLRGAWPNVGIYTHDVIADIVRRTGPRLRFTTGPEGTISDGDFAIPHLSFGEGIKGSDAILAANAYHQRFWGVYDDKTFFWLPTTTFRKRWRIRRSKGHGIDLLGPQAEDAMNGVVVSFTDAAGITRKIGPPGASSCYATSALLADTSASNPVNAAGIERKWGELQLGFTTDVNGAIQVGVAYLQMKLESATSRGSVTVTDLIEDDETGTLYPAWYMRAGDSAIVTDGDAIERRIIETVYSHDSRQLTANMDSTPHKVEALMERMGIVLVGIVE
jgi:hypothetical protein